MFTNEDIAILLYILVKATVVVEKQLKQLQIKPRSKPIRTHDLHHIGAMLYQLSYEASPEAGQV